MTCVLQEIDKNKFSCDTFAFFLDNFDLYFFFIWRKFFLNLSWICISMKYISKVVSACLYKSLTIISTVRHVSCNFSDYLCWRTWDWSLRKLDSHLHHIKQTRFDHIRMCGVASHDNDAVDWQWLLSRMSRIDRN